MQYLSDEWIEAADAALAKAWAERDADDDIRADAQDDEDRPASTTIGYTITETPHGKVEYSLHVDTDSAGVSKGKPQDDPDVTMELDYDTAAQIARAETSPQVAFMQGRLRLGGDVTLLIKGAERLAAIGDAVASVDGVEY